jgi:hypothetical protein
VSYSPAAAQAATVADPKVGLNNTGTVGEDKIAVAVWFTDSDGDTWPTAVAGASDPVGPNVAAAVPGVYNPLAARYAEITANAATASYYNLIPTAPGSEYITISALPEKKFN